MIVNLFIDFSDLPGFHVSNQFLVPTYWFIVREYEGFEWFDHTLHICRLLFLFGMYFQYECNTNIFQFIKLHFNEERKNLINNNFSDLLSFHIALQRRMFCYIDSIRLMTTKKMFWFMFRTWYTITVNEKIRPILNFHKTKNKGGESVNTDKLNGRVLNNN